MEQKFLDSMDRKYRKNPNKIFEKLENLTIRLNKMDKIYNQYHYSSIHISGRDFTDRFHSTYENKNPNDYQGDFLIDNEKKQFNVINLRVEISPFIERPITPKIRIDIETEITCIQDLLDLTEKYPLSKNVEYNIDMHILHKINPSLKELNSMIGMKNLKENIVDQILYFLQELHKNSEGDFLHTVIYGSPGTGKTEVAKIIGKIFKDLGVLKNGTFKKVVRSDLIAGYLGQTAIKTKEVIKEAIGGVLFIDEAYALGSPEKRDSFSKECIDTLCEALSDHKEDLMVIIAGYEEELKTCFFEYNQGLNSRFIWRFKTDKYDENDLQKIFLKKVKDSSWNYSDEIEKKSGWFKKNMDYFQYYGRDMETLWSKTKIAHSRRLFCRKNAEKKLVTMKDLENGFQMFLKNDEVKNRKENEEMKNRLSSIYV